MIGITAKCFEKKDSPDNNLSWKSFAICNQ